MARKTDIPRTYESWKEISSIVTQAVTLVQKERGLRTRHEAEEELGKMLNVRGRTVRGWFDKWYLPTKERPKRARKPNAEVVQKLQKLIKRPSLSYSNYWIIDDFPISDELADEIIDWASGNIIPDYDAVYAYIAIFPNIYEPDELLEKRNITDFIVDNAVHYDSTSWHNPSEPDKFLDDLRMCLTNPSQYKPKTDSRPMILPITDIDYILVIYIVNRVILRRGE